MVGIFARFRFIYQLLSDLYDESEKADLKLTRKELWVLIWISWEIAKKCGIPDSATRQASAKRFVELSKEIGDRSLDNDVLLAKRLALVMASLFALDEDQIAVNVMYS